MWVVSAPETTGGSIPCAQPPSTVKHKLDIRDLRREFHQTVELRKQQEFQEIEEDREIHQRKVLEDSAWELADYQNNLKGKYRVKTAELKKHYQERYNKLEEEEAEKFYQVKVETADKVIAFQRDQEKFAKEQE